MDALGTLSQLSLLRSVLQISQTLDRFEIPRFCHNAFCLMDSGFLDPCPVPEFSSLHFVSIRRGSASKLVVRGDDRQPVARILRGPNLYFEWFQECVFLDSA